MPGRKSTNPLLPVSVINNRIDDIKTSLIELFPDEATENMSLNRLRDGN